MPLVALAAGMRRARRRRCGDIVDDERGSRSAAIATSPSGCGRRRAVCVVAAPQRCSASPASRRLAYRPSARATENKIFMNHNTSQRKNSTTPELEELRKVQGKKRSGADPAHVLDKAIYQLWETINDLDQIQPERVEHYRVSI